MAYIELSGKRGKGHRTIVDDSTFKQYGHLSWYLGDTGYAVRKPGGQIIRLHRLVIGAKEGEIVDHLNGNKLDNRLSNLRICTHKENMQNLKNTKGYCWDKSKKKWIVRYKLTFYGRYDTEEEAQQAYKLACSGVPYKKDKLHKRRKYLPKGVLYMKSQSPKPYYIRPQLNGIKYFRGYFSTVEDAKLAYEQLIKELQQED